MIRRKVAIIGGGLSGSMMAMALANMQDGPEIILIEKNPQMLGRGVAYHHDFTHQPLNVVASAMSLYPDKPMHFYEWLLENHFRYNHLIPEVYPKLFAPRKIFGDYLVENLETVHSKASGRFQIRIDEVVSISEVNGLFQLILDSGVTVEANDVVLALGNFPPADLFPDDHALNTSMRYFSNPWTDKIYSNIAGDENILLLGTGLTAVDVVLGLKVRGFRGKVSMISRRGKLPVAHNLASGPVTLEYPGHCHPRDAYFWFKKILKANKQFPFSAIVDGLRPHTQRFWTEWTIEEKKYFLRRLRPFWEITRHRIPPASRLILENLMNSDQLRIGKGEIFNADVTPGGIKVLFSINGEKNEDVFHKIINCTGPESNYRKVKFPIIRNLIEQKKVVSDILGLGINCTPAGEILNAENSIVPGLWCIGPMRKAALWETTALREIREQVKLLTGHIATAIALHHS
jgi:uncharacterized NAD(P)/FAD-binding protein YdhS